MVITSRVHTTFFAPTSTVSETLIRLPPSVVPQYETKCEHSGKILMTTEKPPHRAHLWSSEEHERFLQGLELFPNGPWKEIAAIVGTKTTRQTMTHAQKYRQKIERRLQERPLKSKKRSKARDRKHRSVTLSAFDKLEQIYGAQAPLHVTNPYLYYQQPKPIACYKPHSLYNEVSDPLYGYVSSPTEVSTDVLDSSYFDQELEALLASLDPLPMLTTEPERVSFV